MRTIRLLGRAAFGSLLWLAIAAAPSPTAQNCRDGAACDPTGSNKSVRLDGVTYPSIQSCLEAAGSGGTCVVPAGSAITLTHPLTIKTSGTTLRCESGAVIQQGSGFDSAHLIEIEANQVTVTGCTLRGDSSATNSALVIANRVSGAIISDDTLENVASKNFGVYIAQAATDFRIEGNRITTGIAGYPVYVISNWNNTAVERGLIRGNTIATVGGISEDDIMIFANTPTASASNMEVSNNVMSAGPDSCATGGCFCVEVGGFGGPGPTDIVVNGNTCTATAGINGGYSLAGTPPSRYSVTGNVYDANNQKTGIAAFELSGREASASHNVGRNLTGPGYCLSINMLSASSIAENDCTGFSHGKNGAGIMVYGGASGNAGDNTISNNRIVFPPSSKNRHYGIWVQCNHVSVNCSGNKLIGNRIEGNGGKATRAIMLERNYGTMSSTTVSGNEIVKTKIGVFIGAGVTDTTYAGARNDAKVPLVNHGKGTVVE